MEEVAGDIWEYSAKNKCIVVIPVNGFVKNNGMAVMGRGLAREASKKFPKLPVALGYHIKHYGNDVHYFEDFNIISFPVKYNWWENADIELIRRSSRQLKFLNSDNLFAEHNKLICMPHVGCGNGKLLWKDVKPIIETYLSEFDNIVICDKVE